MKVLITGGCGFIGSHIAEKFYYEGYDIYIVDNLIAGNQINLKIKYKFYKISVEDKKCSEVFKSASFDCVVFLSSIEDEKFSSIDPYEISKSNILGIINILDCCKSYNVKKFILASSVMAIENEKEHPTPYSMSKYVAEYYTLMWNRLYNINTIIFRISNVYGPRQMISRQSGIIACFMESLVLQKALVVYGDGTNEYDFIYVEDVAECIYKAASSEEEGTFNLSSNNKSSINKIIEMLYKIKKIEDIKYLIDSGNENKYSDFDNTKTKLAFNWDVRYNLSDGLKKTYLWYIEHSKKLPYEIKHY